MGAMRHERDQPEDARRVIAESHHQSCSEPATCRPADPSAGGAS
jgi:hypothetical protein